MKAFLIGVTVVGLSAPLVLQAASAQDIDPRCGEMRDTVACSCALQNGGRLTRPVELKRKGWRLVRGEAQQSDQQLDREKIFFPAKFRWTGWRLRPSAALAGYLACMRSHGRK
jgi:hypothetical protein